MKARPSSRGRSLALAASAFALLLPFPARALDPELQIAQYAHTAWTARDGSFRGSISSIGQTADGYLWLGTGFGLLRYDGARFVAWEPPSGAKLPGRYVSKVYGSRDGSLWIGGEGLARWKDGKLRRYPELDGVAIFAIAEDREGIVWVGGSKRPTTRLCAIGKDDRPRCVGDRGEHGDWVRAIYLDRGGRLWVGSATGVWRLKPGPPRRYADPEILSVPRAIAEDERGDLLIATDGGLRRLQGDAIGAYPLPPGALPLETFSLLRDRDGAVWIGTDHDGIAHLSRGRLDRYGPGDGLSASFAIDLFEDREGNVWVATLQGLDRFRQFAVSTITARQGLASDVAVSVLATRDGSLWVASAKGLDRLLDGAVRHYGTRDGLPHEHVLSMFEDRRGRLWVSTRAARGIARLEGDRFVAAEATAANVFQFAEDPSGDLWISDREVGLVRLDPQGRMRSVTPSSLWGSSRALSLALDPRRGGVWLGTAAEGIFYLSGGQVREHHGVAQGLGDGQVRDLQFDASGALWAATQGGLSRIAGRSVRALDRAGGLPCDAVHWLRGLADESAWLYTECGLVRLSRADLRAWAADPRHRVTPLAFLDHADGVENIFFNTYYTPYAATGRDGRIYFATTGGLAVLDPKNLAENRHVPGVFVERLTADGVGYPLAPPPRLPPLSRDLRLDYSATSLVVPQKVRFRHRLDGYDDGWQEAEGRREVLYRNLPPGDYRFRVIAANDSGLWNERGAALAFSIRPAFYQTRGFLALVAALAALAAWGLYRLRVRQVTGRLAARYEERIAERTRIAQELHDTLLQGFLSASMQLSAAVGRMPPDAPEKPRLDTVLDLVRRMVGEGRNAVLGLRSGGPEGEDLERALARVPEETGHAEPVAFRVASTGAPRPLQEGARHELYRIGREALVNAFLHAQPKNVEVEIDHGRNALRLRVRDDGAGFDPGRASAEGEGHWGISGMRERAERIGARFAIWSAEGRGTEVELILPAALAYRKDGRRWLGLRRRA